MPGMDIFTNDAFGMQSMTAAVNERPFIPSRIRSSGLFQARGVTTTTIAIERKGTALSLVQTSPRGSAPDQRVRDQRDMRDLRVPRLAKEAVVYADQVQNVRAFGSETDLEMVQSVVNQEVDNVRTEIDLTEENLMLGAIKGIVADADGSTIYDLFSEFGVSQLGAIDFALGTSGTDVRKKCSQVIRSMGDELKVGNMPFRVRALCGDEFFDSLIAHPKVVDAYQRWQAGAALRDDYTYQTFRFGGIEFENYRGTADDSVGIGSKEARFYAEGVPGLFVVAYAPADTMDAVNTVGLPRYVIPGMDPTGKNRWQSFEVQANVLPFCTRPKSLIEGSTP